ncbi:hypothetical protein EJB05_37478, partial [Eragrostis curvula]
ERVRLRQEGNQILNHGSASTDELGKAAERWSAKRIAPRRFSKLEAWTQDQQSDMFQLTKVTKRQRIASNQLCDITPWGKLKKYLTAIKFIAIMKGSYTRPLLEPWRKFKFCLNVVKFVVRMKAGVRGHQGQKHYSTTHGSAATDELAPSKGIGLEVFCEPEAWSRDVETDGYEVTKVARRERLLKNVQSSTFNKPMCLCFDATSNCRDLRFLKYDFLYKI